MEQIAVVGTGVIGTMLGGFLTGAGHEVTVISQFREETARTLDREGITILFGTERIHTPVRAKYAGELTPEDCYDIIFITGKSNDTELIVKTMLPHLAEKGYFCSLQNGMSEDMLIPLVGKDRVIPCVCFAGGQVPQTGTVITHDGYFIIGELDGQDTPRLHRLEKILSGAKRVIVTAEILKARWNKLAEVCLTVPCACIAGYPLFNGFEDPEMQKAFACLALEELAVAKAIGVCPDPIMGMTPEEWVLLRGGDETVSQAFTTRNMRPMPKEKPEENAAPKLLPADAYTQDIRKGRPLEIWYTNGWVKEKAAELGIPTPAQNKLLELVQEIEAGRLNPARKNLAQVIQAAE